jgi:hypothetical protein
MPAPGVFPLAINSAFIASAPAGGSLLSPASHWLTALTGKFV